MRSLYKIELTPGARVPKGRHLGKSARLFAGTGRFHRRVERNQVRLKAMPSNECGDIGDFAVAFGHPANDFRHHLAVAVLFSQLAQAQSTQFENKLRWKLALLHRGRD
jgi:hypothetical protein